MTLSFELSRGIDVEGIAEVYHATGRAQIEPFILAEHAEVLRAHLLERDDWLLKLRGAGSRTFQFKDRDLDSWEPARKEALRKLVAPVDSDSFCYAYRSILALNEHKELQETDTPLAEFASFLSSQAVVDLLRAITGEASLNFADAFASRYGAGDFLTVHHDKKEGSPRLAAYVFGLTPVWRPEWGGLLLFHQGKGDVLTGLGPRFNVLSLFAVPQDHSVSLVAPFAPVPRLSVTGWLRPLPTDTENQEKVVAEEGLEPPTRGL